MLHVKSDEISVIEKDEIKEELSPDMKLPIVGNSTKFMKKPAEIEGDTVRTPRALEEKPQKMKRVWVTHRSKKNYKMLEDLPSKMFSLRIVPLMDVEELLRFREANWKLYAMTQKELYGRYMGIQRQFAPLTDDL